MQLPPVIEKMHELNVWLLNKVGKFPKDKRFILGEKLAAKGLNIQEMLIQAALMPKGDEKSKLLRDINLMLEQLRYLVRLAADLNCMNRKAHYYCAKNMIEIGRMIGGWIGNARDFDVKTL